MIKIAIVAGKHNTKLEEALNSKEMEVVKKFTNVDDLWNEVLDMGSSMFVDVDKIIVLPTGMLNPTEMPLVDQFENIQAPLVMNDVRSDLHVITKSSDFEKEVEENKDRLLQYSKASLLLLKDVKLAHVKNVAEGRYDDAGVSHPDFNKQIDDVRSSGEEEVEEKEVEEEPVVIPKAEYVDTEEKEKEIQRSKREEAKQQREAEKMKKKEEARLLKEKKERERKSLLASKGTKKKRTEKKDDRKESIQLRNGVFIVTGDRQSGVSSVVANMAELYTKKGKSVLVIDTDVKRRTQTFYFNHFYEEMLRESRVGQGYLAALNSPRMLDDICAVVSRDVALLGISMELDNNIKKFANKPIDRVVNSSNMVTLLGMAKSMFDVVLLDVPLEEMYRIGGAVSYADTVLMCTPNNEHNLNTLLEVELDFLMEHDDVTGNTLMNKAKLLLTKYTEGSKIDGKEINERNLMDVLQNMEESYLHLEVVGRVTHSSEYAANTGKGLRASKNMGVAEEFYSFMEKL